MLSGAHLIVIQRGFSQTAQLRESRNFLKISRNLETTVRYMFTIRKCRDPMHEENHLHDLNIH